MSSKADEDNREKPSFEGQTVFKGGVAEDEDEHENDAE